MSNNRRHRAKKNIFTSIFTQIMTVLCGIVVPWMMISAFGSESYGAVSSITQFLAYITLLEGGIGGVARAVLYKPLAENDIDTISAIMLEVKRFFRIVAYIFVIYVLVLACSFHYISNITSLDWLTTFLLVIVISISTFSQYFIGISYAILLQAAQKTYINNMVSIGGIIFNAITTIVLILMGYNLIIVKLVSSFIFIMRPLFFVWYVRKHYKLKENILLKKTKEFLSQKWVGLGQHISFFLHSNTDIVVLTVLTNLRIVAVYSVYNMIVSQIQNFAISFTSGMESVFGDLLARNEKQQICRSFGTYETIISIVSMILFSTTAVLIIPFIRLYTTNVTDADYIQPLFALLLILTAIGYCLRLPYHAMVIAAGHFRQTSMAAYGEAIINIFLSISLVYVYGLIGVVLATLIATWSRFFYYVIYLSNNIFYRDIKLFIKRFMVNVTVFGFNCMLGYKIIELFKIDDYFIWSLCGVILVITTGISTLIINYMFFKEDCRSLFLKFNV